MESRVPSGQCFPAPAVEALATVPEDERGLRDSIIWKGSGLKIDELREKNTIYRAASIE